MNHQIGSSTKTKWAVAAIVALAALGIAAPLAFADNIGAPTSAAGGVSAPSSPSRPAAAGALGGSSSGGSIGGGSYNEDYQPLKLQPPGTGKFEGPKNGTNTPCVGTTGFGSSNVQPGHGC
jgi:hypothetical protein